MSRFRDTRPVSVKFTWNAYRVVVILVISDQTQVPLFFVCLFILLFSYRGRASTLVAREVRSLKDNHRIHSEYDCLVFVDEPSEGGVCVCVVWCVCGVVWCVCVCVIPLPLIVCFIMLYLW